MFMSLFPESGDAEGRVGDLITPASVKPISPVSDSSLS